jgi:hypothetical protein
MKSSIVTAIRQKASEHGDLQAVYGMGSFFRGDKFRDLDLVAIVTCTTVTLRQQAELIRRTFNDLGVVVGVPIDLTIFTPAEFSERPLRDMSTLIAIYTRDGLG